MGLLPKTWSTRVPMPPAGAALGVWGEGSQLGTQGPAPRAGEAGPAQPMGTGKNSLLSNGAGGGGGA